MNWIDFVGTLAGILTTVAFIPQVVKTWRSRSADDISLLMFLVFTVGVFCWLLYGIGLNSMPIIIANSVTLLLAGSILVLKLQYMWLKRRRIQAVDQRSL